MIQSAWEALKARLQCMVEHDVDLETTASWWIELIATSAGDYEQQVQHLTFL